MTYLLGIDASKFKHDCIIADEYGNALTKPFTIENNRNLKWFKISRWNQNRFWIYRTLHSES